MRAKAHIRCRGARLRYDVRMDKPVIALVSTLVVAAVYLFRHFIGRRYAEFDGGVVSQSWLIEHRAGTQDDRYS
jgi:hypothetical protein